MSTFPDAITLASAVQPWWNNQTAGMIGGFAGAALGLWGAMFGITAGLLVPKGKGKTAIRILVYPMIAVALVALGIGIVAITKDQPRSVWYPLVLLGGILIIQLGWMIPLLELTLRKIERKRLEAEELRRS